MKIVTGSYKTGYKILLFHVLRFLKNSSLIEAVLLFKVRFS